MLQHHPRIRVIAPVLLPTVAVFMLVAGGSQPAQAFVCLQLPTLREVCKEAEQIAVLRVEKINGEKKAIVYRKVRDLKGTFPGRTKEFEGTFTHILRKPPNPESKPLDIANQDQLNESILRLTAEGKTAVMFLKGTIASVCVGQAWYTLRVQNDGVVDCGGDSRFSRVYCGDVEELSTAVTDILDGKEVVVPRMVGDNRMLNDRTAPIRRRPADKADPEDPKDRHVACYLSPFRDQTPWSTHRGAPQRTGADDGPGPKGPKVLWAYKSPDHFIAPLVPGTKELFASGLGAFNSPGFYALALDPATDKQV